MENLSLKDRRRRQSAAFGSKGDNYDSYVARLPTPDESTPSHRSSDDERRNKVTRRHSPDRSSMRASEYSARLQNDALFAQRGGQGRAPDSPPYQASDAQKPSLPPLKTILAGSLTSPPRSPTFNCHSVQPSPQEPAYTSATYKPPSLYPQKKQRTEYILEPVPPISTTTHTSPFLKSDAFDRLAYRAPPNDSSHSPRAGYGDARRTSIQPHPGYPSSSSPRSSYHQVQSSFSENLQSNAGPTANAPYKQAHSAAASPLEYRQQRQNDAYQTSPQATFDTRFERRDSTQASFDQPYPHANHRIPPPTDSHLQQHARQHSHNDAERSPYAVRRMDERPAEGHYTPYQASQPSFFMPSQYDYRHGRARKRSNLPKQSTEIMKTWFDQNITNPYPSEEQKAVFSNATGISMTQVSNWFINHRRRCPELRDKRERTRGRELEV